MLSFSVPIFGKTLKSPPSTKGAGLRARQSFAIPDLIQDPEVRPNIHKIIMHTPGFTGLCYASPGMTMWFTFF